MSLSSRLKDATWASHQSAEARAWQKALARGEADPERLGLYLAQLRRVHAALEQGADAVPDWAAGIGWCEAMRHTRNLDRDLDALGAAEAPELPATAALTQALVRAVAAEPAALLGFLYVLEGSMNGNRFLLRALRRGPAAARCSFAYFDPYGEDQPARWVSFKAALDRVTLGPEDEAAVLAAALAAFDGLAAISESILPAPVR